jgi:hypothetical protein
MDDQSPRALIAETQPAQEPREDASEPTPEQTELDERSFVRGYN